MYKPELPLVYFQGTLFLTNTNQSPHEQTIRIGTLQSLEKNLFTNKPMDNYFQNFSFKLEYF